MKRLLFILGIVIILVTMILLGCNIEPSTENLPEEKTVFLENANVELERIDEKNDGVETTNEREVEAFYKGEKYEPLGVRNKAGEEDKAHGYDGKAEFLTKYEYTFYGLNTFVIKLLSEKQFQIWENSFGDRFKPKRTPWEYTTYNFIHEMNIPKEEFIKANNGYSYTDEEIEALYSKDQKLLNKIFVNEYALLIDDEIYTADWLATRTIRDYKKIDITDQTLNSYLNKIDIIELKDEYVTIQGVLQKAQKAGLLQDKQLLARPKSKLDMLSAYQPLFYGVDDFLYEIVDEKKLEEWKNQFLLEYGSSRDIRECNVYNAVYELEIPKESFIKANQGLVYTEEQIEAIYSGDVQKVNEIFVNEYALLYNGRIFTADEIVYDMKNEGEALPVEVVEKYINQIDIQELQEEKEHLRKKIEALKR